MKTELEKREILRLNNEESNKVTKECLQYGLLYLMGDKPFSEISVTEIVRRAGVSRTAFYRNYSTKEDILKEIGESIMRQVLDVLDLAEYEKKTYDWFLLCFQQLLAKKDSLKLIINAHIPIERFIPGGSLIETKYPSDTYVHHYKKIAAEAAFHKIVTEWILNGATESPEEMSHICEEVFSPSRFTSHAKKTAQDFRRFTYDYGDESEKQK